MAQKVELEVTVDEDARDKREDFVGSVAIALSIGGVRIRSGAYRVTIEKLPAKKTEDTTDVDR